ncbi:hypothetical protein COO60DRAFT_130766 [Scenedesmus sp. NREL 46B-D3]|nr:hypothetical protein COO60DRAFT_130766 [Scenedesmus sp. NREL 46B-D3]
MQPLATAAGSTRHRFPVCCAKRCRSSRAAASAAAAATPCHAACCTDQLLQLLLLLLPLEGGCCCRFLACWAFLRASSSAVGSWSLKTRLRRLTTAVAAGATAAAAGAGAGVAPAAPVAHTCMPLPSRRCLAPACSQQPLLHLLLGVHAHAITTTKACPLLHNVAAAVLACRIC